MKNKKRNILRLIRTVLAALFFTGVTLLFLDVTGTLHTWLGWMAKIQILPAFLALNVATVVVLLILTLIFGRVYCSVICPLGVMQDIISWTRGKIKKKDRFRFRYVKNRPWLRIAFLVLFIVTMAFGVSAIAGILAPYSTYGRIAQNLFAPVYTLGNNLIAWICSRFDSYAFYSREVWIRSISTFAVSAATFVLLAVLAWRNGRTWCNNVCPVGSVLGFISKFSLFAPVIDTSKCRSCGLCSRQCKASCIDIANFKVDTSRCVSCMDCISTCNDGAIRYRFRYGQAAGKMLKPEDQNGKVAGPEQEHKGKGAGPEQEPKGPDTGRRAFLVGAALVGASSLKAQQKEMTERLAPERRHKVPKRETPIVPAGSASLKHFTDHCTACQLCVNTCPNNVLRPSSSLERFMQPEMSYERGYCRPECTDCSKVCPAGAIIEISPQEKASTQIGHAIVDYNLCVVNTDSVHCGNCAKHCPAGAISMVPADPEDSKSARIPSVDESRCIGCGACENLCPSAPYPAIHVEGHEVHRTI